MERIVIAGASGFMGTYLRRRFEADGAGVRTVGRAGADATWGDEKAITALVDGADLVLNLAGKSVNCRYNGQNKAEIFRSRLETTAELGRSIAGAATPPRLWINSSTATIYRHADDHPQTDDSGEIGSGFSVDVATSWEDAFFAVHRDGVRQVAIRTAIVLGDGSALKPLLFLARVGLGGPQLGGKSQQATGHGGRQMFSWIHIADVWRAIRFIQSTPSIEGTVNLAAPSPVQNRELMATLRSIVRMPVGIPAFEWMLRLGAVALRTETELLLKSRWVLPTRLQAHGFDFEFPTIREAVEDIRADGASGGGRPVPEGAGRP